ncbi:MAG: ABC transporter permease [Planctomycetota bacterium]
MAVHPAIRVLDPRDRYSPVAVFRSAWRERRLILRLARRQIEARYRGSVLGLVWAVLIPLLMLGVYTFVFSAIFPSKWTEKPPDPNVAESSSPTTSAAAVRDAGDSGGETLPVSARAAAAQERRGLYPFVLVLFTGLILFNLFAESVNRAPGLMLENVTYIKKVIFPLEIMVWVTVLVALFNALVSGALLLLGYLAFRGVPPPAALLLPVLLIPLILLTVGLCWFLASFGVYFRDLAQFIPVLTTVLLFVSPIFYPQDSLVEKVPGVLRPLVYLNPIGASVEPARLALFKGQWPDWRMLLAQTAFGWLIAWLGLAWFTKTRKGFADVV